MARIISSIADGITGLVHEAVQLTDVIMSHKHQKGDNAEFIPFHGDEDITQMKGKAYDNIAQYINEHFKDLTQEDAQQIYNTMRNGIDKAKILMEKCDKKGLQFRVVRLDTDREFEKENEKHIMIESGSTRYDKAKEIFKSASDVIYLGSVMLVKNLSNNNGDSLEISSCSVIPNGDDMTDPSKYDGDDNTVNIYNKEVYSRFIPSTSTVFYTKSINEIISQYSLRDDWQDKKQQILEKLAYAMDKTVEELKNDGQNIRCISRVSELKEKGIDSFDSLRQNSAGLKVKEKFCGKNIELINKYFKFGTTGTDTKYHITLFEMYLTGKTNNLNATADLETEKKYSISNLSEDKVHGIIDDLLAGKEDSKKYNEIVIRQRLSKYKEIVLKNGKFVKPYKGEPLQKGEEVLESTGEVFDF